MYSIPPRAKVDDEGRRNEEESGHRRSALGRSSPSSSAVDPAAAPRLLDALRERLRYMHYSLRTEEAYVYWVRGFVRWSDGRRHPREMGGAEVQGFLSMLANAREPLFPCYRATPSSTARATSAS
jgi:hypothetical protein